MANGKFSQPRPYRDEEREIEHAFRQMTGQEPPSEPQPKEYEPISEDYQPLPENFAQEDFSSDPPDFPLDNSPAQPPVQKQPLQPPQPEIPNQMESLDYGEDEPDFVDKLQTWFHTTVAFCKENPKMVMVGLCALALVIIIGFMAAFFFGTSDPYNGKILRNVYVANVNVGGMTKNEAVSAVKQASMAYAQQDMVVNLSGTPLHLKPADTKVSLNAKAAVNAAYDYGRTGSKAEREQIYLASMSENHYIGLLPYLDLNQDYIRQVLAAYAKDTGSTLKQPAYGLEGTMPKLGAEEFDEKVPCQTLVITMGTPGVGFDADDVFKQVLDAYSMAYFLVEVQNVDSVAEPDPIDLEALYEEFYIAPVNATVDMQTFKTIPGSYGYGFDLEQAQKLLDGANYGDAVRIPMEYIEPEILGEDVFFRDVLGSCKTSYSNNANRTNNLEVACRTINGTVLNPGEEFSYNKALGERTKAKGYKNAPSYSGLKLVDTIGGGICQVSSTLYYSAMQADLTITDRTNHGFVPTYIDYGMDATVSWGGPDFKFRNNTNYPIKIEAEVSGGYVQVRIMGTDEKDYYIKLDYTITDTIKPETEYQDFAFDNKEGYKDGDVIEDGTTGYVVKTYRLKYDKETNALISKDFEATSRYTAVSKVVARVEPEETEPPTTEETEPPTTETTAPPTETTDPTTEPTTEPSTAPPETTEEPTTAPTTEPLPIPDDTPVEQAA